MSYEQRTFLETLASLAAKPGRSVKASDVHARLGEVDEQVKVAARSGLTRELIDDSLIEISWNRPPRSGGSPIAYYRLNEAGQGLIDQWARADEITIAAPGKRFRPSALAGRFSSAAAGC